MSIHDNYVSLETSSGGVFVCLVSTSDAGSNTLDPDEARLLAKMLIEAADCKEAGASFDAKIHLSSGIYR